MPGIKIGQKFQTWNQNRKEKKQAKKGKLNQTDVTPSAPEAMPPVRPQLQPTALVDPRMLQERQAEHSLIEKPLLVVTGESDHGTRPYGWAVEPDELPTYQQATGQPSKLTQPVSLEQQKKTLKKQISQQQGAVNKSKASLEKLEKKFDEDVKAAKSSTKKAKALSQKSSKRQTELQTAEKKMATDEAKLKALSDEMALLEALERNSADTPVAAPSQTRAVSQPMPEVKTEPLEEPDEEAEKKVALTDTPASDEVEENEAATEHHSRLGSLIKPFITVNKAQVQAAHDLHDTAREEFETARKNCKTLRKTKADLEKKLKNAGKNKIFESSRQKAAAQSKQLTEDLVTATEKLEKAEASLPLYQQQLNDAEQDLKEAEKNTDNLVNFTTHFATSLRTMHKLSRSSKPEDKAELDRRRTIRAPQLVIDSPDGRMQVDNLSLKLRVLKFEKKGSHWAPVLGIEAMTGKVSFPCPISRLLN